MFHFDPTINLGNLITAIVLVVGLWRWSLSQNRREQKIDLVLFGDDDMGVAGICRDVSGLKDDAEDLFAHLQRLGPQFAINRRHAERRGHERREH